MSFLKIVNVSLQLPFVEKPILSDLSYQVNQGDFIIILGSNGSGKSSLLKLIDRRYQATAGNIYLNQKSILNFSNKDFSRAIVTLTQNCNESLFPSLTLFENFLLVKEQHESHLFSLRKKEERDFFATYLVKFNENLSHKLDQLVEKLSGGEKQALALALSVLYPPQILLLDEHTSALDPNSAKKIMSLTQEVIKQRKITCILATHDLEIALNYGNRILALKQGKIFQMIDENRKKTFDQQQLLLACY